MPPQLVLASSSRYRHELLARLGLPFTAVSPDIDETPHPGESVEALVRRLSLAKAKALIETCPDHLIIGSDQAAEFNHLPVGKPGSLAAAVAQLTMMSGKTIVFHTGLSVFHSGRGYGETVVIRTEVEFRLNPLARIERYLALEPAFDCAGSFKSESLGATLCRRISSDDPTALIGLPLLAVVELLEKFGVELPCSSPDLGQ